MIKNILLKIGSIILMVGILLICFLGNSFAGEENEDNTESEEWTDFSNVEFELKKDGTISSIIYLTNFEAKEDTNYYCYFSNSPNKPNITFVSLPTGTPSIKYSEEKNLYYAKGNQLNNYCELSGDIYMSILEYKITIDGAKEHISLYGKKLEKFEEANDYTAFALATIRQDKTLISLNFSHGYHTERKIQVKVGKISDVSILQKLKDEDVLANEELLSYVKNASGLFNQNLQCNKLALFEYEDNEGLNITGIEDNQYYYLYVKTDDENGKYVSNEAVTFARAIVIGNDWNMFFYDEDNFEWSDFGTKNDDTTVQKTDITTADTTTSSIILPNTGWSIMVTVLAIVTLIGIAILMYLKYNKYKEIK